MSNTANTAKAVKIIAVLLLLALCATVLVGCGKTLSDENGFVRINEVNIVTETGMFGLRGIDGHFSAEVLGDFDIYAVDAGYTRCNTPNGAYGPLDGTYTRNMLYDGRIYYSKGSLFIFALVFYSGADIEGYVVIAGRNDGHLTKAQVRARYPFAALPPKEKRFSSLYSIYYDCHIVKSVRYGETNPTLDAVLAEIAAVKAEHPFSA